MPNNNTQEKPMTLVERGLLLSLDYALSLISEFDEHRLVNRLIRLSDAQGFWDLINALLTNDIDTCNTKTLGIKVLEKLYCDDNKDQIKALILKLLDSTSFDDINLVIKFVNEVEDPIFLDRLLALEKRPHLPCWLQDTLKDVITTLRRTNDRHVQ